jgi:hypothetical protein
MSMNDPDLLMAGVLYQPPDCLEVEASRTVKVNKSNMWLYTLLQGS